jgi:hypothetical protein
VYTIQRYETKCVSDLLKVTCFLCVSRCPTPFKPSK